jgi:hypothetical protein
MRKLLVVGALAVIALAVLMLHEIRAGVDAAPTAPAPSPAPTITPPPQPATAPIKIAKPAPEPESDGKVNANSDDFLDRFVDKQPRMASRAAMSCYKGGLHRRTMDQWIRFSFTGHVKNGEVTFSDVKTLESRLDDKELEDCMLAAVANTHWHDDSLPDTESYPDQTTLNPERGGKKYLHAADDDATPAPPDTPR